MPALAESASRSVILPWITRVFEFFTLNSQSSGFYVMDMSLKNELDRNMCWLCSRCALESPVYYDFQVSRCGPCEDFVSLTTWPLSSFRCCKRLTFVTLERTCQNSECRCPREAGTFQGSVASLKAVCECLGRALPPQADYSYLDTSTRLRWYLS